MQKLIRCSDGTLAVDTTVRVQHCSCEPAAWTAGAIQAEGFWGRAHVLRLSCGNPDHWIPNSRLFVTFSPTTAGVLDTIRKWVD